MPHSGPLLLGLDLMREMLNASPVGYVAAILSTAIIIAEAVQASKNVDKDFEDLGAKVVELSLACSKLSSSKSESQDIQLYAGIYIRSLEHIATTIIKTPRRGLIGRLTGRTAKAKTLRELEEQLEHSSALLSLHLQMSNLQKSTNENNARQIQFQDAIANAQQEQLDLIRRRMAKASEKRVKERSTFSHHPPPSPQHFYGREDHVQHLVDSFQTVPAYQAILGPGGMGKTSLSLHVFHDLRVVAIYGKHRYFLSCESIQDADGLTAGLANIFDLQEKNVVSQLKRVCSIIGSDILFLLDNFETTWEKRETRENVETILGHLTAIPNLSIMITLRGGERPAGVPWTRPFLPPIPQLSIEASKELFMSISDVDGSDPCLEELIIAVEGLPLAVTLLASQAQSSSCSKLLSAWEDQKTSMVTRGFDGRLSNLDTSINLSIVSSRMKNDDAALPTLQILSFLPDGATTTDLALMQLDEEQSSRRAISASTTLCQTSLAYVTGDQRMRALSPIREYVRANYPPDQNLFRRIFDFHRKATQYAAELESSPQWMTMTETLAPFIGNIHSIIYAALTKESLAFPAIEACIDIASFHSCAFLGSIDSLLNACLDQARNLRYRNLEAGCHLVLAKLHPHSPDSARDSAKAASIYRELDRKDSLLKALCVVADCASNMSQPSLAESNLTEAAEILSDDSPLEDRVELLLQTGLMLTRTGRYDEAGKTFDDALPLLGSHNSPWTRRKLYSSLCNHYLTCDRLDDAIKAALDGLAVPGFQGHWISAPLLWNISMAYYLQGRFVEADDAVSTAWGISLRCARETHMIWSKYFLAWSAIGNQRLDEAELHLHGGWVLLQAASGFLLSLLSLRFVSLLGHLELFKYNIATASAHFDEVKRIGQEAGLQTEMGVVPFYLHPKSYILARTGSAKLSMHSSIYSIVLCGSGKQEAHTAVSLLILGDAYILEEDPDTITARSCYEVGLSMIRHLGFGRFLPHADVRLAAVDWQESASDNAYLEKAETRFHRAAKLYREIGHYPAERFCLDQLQSVRAKEAINVATLLSLPYPM